MLSFSSLSRFERLVFGSLPKFWPLNASPSFLQNILVKSAIALSLKHHKYYGPTPPIPTVLFQCVHNTSLKGVAEHWMFSAVNCLVSSNWFVSLPTDVRERAVNDARNGRPVFPRTHKFEQPLGRFLLLPGSMVAKLVHEMCGQADIAALNLRWIFSGGRSRKEVPTKRLNQYRQICHSADAWRGHTCVFQFPWSSHLRGMPIQWQAATCVGCNAARTVSPQ